jgi:tetratricopeptide (TPR) repeat protein
MAEAKVEAKVATGCSRSKLQIKDGVTFRDGQQVLRTPQMDSDGNQFIRETCHLCPMKLCNCVKITSRSMADAKRSEKRRRPEELAGRALAKQARYKKKKEEEEEKALRHKIKLGPHDSLHHKRLGFILQENGRFVEAKDEYEKSIELYFDDPTCHSLLAELLKEMRQFSESKAEYRIAIKLDPENTYYPRDLAELEEDEENEGGEGGEGVSAEADDQVCGNIISAFKCDR